MREDLIAACINFVDRLATENVPEDIMADFADLCRIFLTDGEVKRLCVAGVVKILLERFKR